MKLAFSPWAGNADRQVLDCGDGAPAESPLWMGVMLVRPECGGLGRGRSQSGDSADSVTAVQKLAQCRSWVQNHLPHIEIIETSSNARSAELAADEKNSAAITGSLAAERYGLRILESDVQDNAANATRFLVLGRQCGPSTGHDRTSLMFSIADQVGALHRALAPFRRYRINMTKIESRPSKRKVWEYFFFVDCDGHFNDRKVAKAIEQLGQHCSFVKVLGSFPNAE